MPQSAEETVLLLDVEQVGERHFRGAHPKHTSLAKAYGGQLLAQALVAASLTVADGRPPHTAHAFFIRPAASRAPVEYAVETVHEGRSTSVRVVAATQGGLPVLRLMASYQDLEPGLTHSVALPDVPGPNELPVLQDAMREGSDLDHAEWADEWAALDIRYHTPGPIATTSDGPGSQQLWVRVRGHLPDDPALHRHLIAYLSDLTLLSSSLRPHGLMLGAPELPRATMNHTIWFHEDARADEWLLIDQRSPWAGGARGLAFASVHTRNGRPVASLAQEGLIRPYGELRARLLPPG